MPLPSTSMKVVCTICGQKWNQISSVSMACNSQTISGTTWFLCFLVCHVSHCKVQVSSFLSPMLSVQSLQKLHDQLSCLYLASMLSSSIQIQPQQDNPPPFTIVLSLSGRHLAPPNARALWNLAIRVENFNIFNSWACLRVEKKGHKTLICQQTLLPTSNNS